MMDIEEELAGRVRFACDAARRAGDLILRYYEQTDLAVEFKADESPVTAADRGAEQLLRDLIAAAFPEDGVLGEEFGARPGSSGWRWILDPVDGTKSFVHGVPLFGTLIGIERTGDCVAGVCRFPALDEMVWASTGSGTWWQHGRSEPVRAHVSDTGRLEEALFCYSGVAYFDRTGRRGAFDKLSARCRLARGWGDCYGHVLVATGRADVMIDPVLNPWDAAALIPIVTEAGGVFMDWTGRTTMDGGDGISVNGPLREAVLTVVRQG